MKRVAEAGKPPVVIPVVFVAIDVHVALVIPAVEGGNCVMCHPYHRSLVKYFHLQTVSHLAS